MQAVPSLGPLAHLVERFHGMEEVTGPNPVGSTKKKDSLRLSFFLITVHGEGGGGKAGEV